MPRRLAVRAKTPVNGKPRSVTKSDLDMGHRILLRRTEINMSQSDLGKILGVSFQQIQKYEKGKNRVGAGRLQQIAEALDVPITFFYEGSAKVREVETLLALDASFSLRLLKAYTAVKDLVVRRHFVSLLESVAGREEAAS